MTKAKDRKFKDLSGGHTEEEIIEKRMRAEKGKLRERARMTKQRAKKGLFMK